MNLNYIYFRYSRFERKITKLFEFWKLYVEWCIFFDKKTDELYNKKYNEP